jgi:predicted nucleotidyltransferase
VLPEIFKTGPRITILRHILTGPPATVQDIAGATGTSKALVSRYLTVLARYGLLTRDGRIYRRTDGSLTRAVKVLLNLDRLMPLISLPEWADGIGIYGSWADGSNTGESDLDLWVLADAYPGEGPLGQLISLLTGALGVEVHLLFLSPPKLRDLRKEDPPFYHAFIRSAIVLRGKGVELP